MGACLTRDNRKTRQEEESLGKISNHTVFHPEEPYQHIPASLAKPPQLAAVLQMRTFEQKSSPAGQSLFPEQPQKKNLEEFLKNDSVSIFMGSQIKSEHKQTAQKMTLDHKTHNIGKQKQHHNQENCQSEPQNQQKAFGSYSVDLGANLQHRSIPPVLTRSAINLC